MHPSTHPQLFSINIKVKRPEKGPEVMSWYIQTNNQPPHMHLPPSIANSRFSKGLLELLSESLSPKVPSFQGLKLQSSKALF